MLKLIEEPRARVYAFMVKVWLPVAAYAVAHDQYIVRIEPRHFTEYHRRLWGIESPAWQAAANAFLASIGPGFLLGLACVLVGWTGSYPRISNRFVLTGVFIVLCAAEVASLWSGWWVRQNGRSFYPEWAFPEFTLSLMTTQTIQLTCYFASAVFSAMLLGVIAWRRYHLNRARGSCPGEGGR